MGHSYGNEINNGWSENVERRHEMMIVDTSSNNPGAAKVRKQDELIT